MKRAKRRKGSGIEKGKKSSMKGMQMMTAKRMAWAAAGAAVLVTAVLWAFWGVWAADFVYFDDNGYVFENAMVQRGLGWGTVKWAFTTLEAANWHPLTWLSHALDVTVFGEGAGGPHAVSLGLHLANAVWVALLLWRLTGSGWAGAVAAGLWAVHPMRVESVAWVSERKDLLALFWGLAALWVYAGGRGKAGSGRMWGCTGLFVLSVLSKPSFVTLPCVMVVLDGVWWGWDGGWNGFGRSVWKKRWLWAIVVGECVMTVVAQHGGGATVGLEAMPMGVRVANAVASVGEYLWRWAWTGPLSCLVPLWRDELTWGRIGCGVAVLVVICGAVTWGMQGQGMGRRGAAAGGLWFLGTLVPVIGLVQVGGQAWASRYSLIPHLGLALVVAGGLAEGVRRGWARNTYALITTAAVVLGAAWGLRTRAEVRAWQGTESLFEQSLAACPRNPSLLGNYGTWHARAGRFVEALELFERSLALRGGDAVVLYEAGTACASLGRTEAAKEYWRRSMRASGTPWEAPANLAWVLSTEEGTGAEELAEAEIALTQAEKLAPNTAIARANLLDNWAALLAARGDREGAMRMALKAMQEAEATGQKELAGRIRERCGGNIGSEAAEQRKTQGDYGEGM